MNYQGESGDSGISGESGYPHACTRTRARSTATRAHARPDLAQEPPIAPNPPEAILARAEADPSFVAANFALVATATDYAKPSQAVLAALALALRIEAAAVRAERPEPAPIDRTGFFRAPRTFKAHAKRNRTRG